VVPSIIDLVAIYCDNNEFIAKEKEPRSHQLSKHVLRRFHFIREIIEKKNIKIKQVHTEKNMVNPLTKVLFQRKHDHHMKWYGIRYMDDWL